MTGLRTIEFKACAPVPRPEDRPWGIRDFVVVDPTGVPWRIGQGIEEAS
jgi:uncharacterized glyoxalase superfamily protein PhnB